MHLFLRQSVIVAVSLLERRVSELLRSVAASDSESSVSGVDVFAADVHPSPFRTKKPMSLQVTTSRMTQGRDIQVFLDSQRSPTTPVSLCSSDSEVLAFQEPVRSSKYTGEKKQAKRQHRGLPPEIRLHYP